MKTTSGIFSAALVAAAFIAFATVSIEAQTAVDQLKSPKEVLERFCKLDTEGTWLGPERWHELTDFFTSVQSWPPDDSVSVLKNYSLGEAKRSVVDGTVYYEVDVDYFVWGSINSFLRFTRAELSKGKSSAAGEPVERVSHKSLSLTDSFVMGGPIWNEEKTKGTLRWRMNGRGGSSNVSVDAAIRWVTETRDKSNDPAMKYNAERTLAILKSLSTGVPVPALPAVTGTAEESPSKVASRFVDLESGLLPDQWSALGEFFVSVPKPRWNKVHIVDLVSSDAEPKGIETNGGTTGFDVPTNLLGELDSSLRLSNYPSFRMLPGNNNSACYGDDYLGITLLLSEKHWQIAQDATVKELDGPLAWRIEDTFFEPFITLDTAIRYVTQTRDKTADPVIKKNAAKTLAILRNYKQGTPLPKQFLSGSRAPCS